MQRQIDNAVHLPAGPSARKLACMDDEEILTKHRQTLNLSASYSERRIVDSNTLSSGLIAEKTQLEHESSKPQSQQPGMS